MADKLDYENKKDISHDKKNLLLRLFDKLKELLK